VPKKRKRGKVKKRILEALAKMASSQEEGLSEMIRRALAHYVKKSRRKTKSARRRSRSRAAKR
jgi:hypothetical protein